MNNEPNKELDNTQKEAQKPGKASAKKPPSIEGGTIITKSARSKASLLPKRDSVGKPPVKKRAASTQQADNFGSQHVDFSKFIFMPEGYEKFFLALYFLVVPYIVGMIFLFFFVAHTSITNFTTLNLTTFIVVWAIGYEIVGSIILILIFYSAFNFKKKTLPNRQRKRRDYGNSSFSKVHKLS